MNAVNLIHKFPPPAPQKKQPSREKKIHRLDYCLVGWDIERNLKLR